MRGFHFLNPVGGLGIEPVLMWIGPSQTDFCLRDSGSVQVLLLLQFGLGRMVSGYDVGVPK